MTNERLIEKAAQAAYSQDPKDFWYLSESLREHWRNVARRVITFWEPHAEPDTESALRIGARYVRNRGLGILVDVADTDQLSSGRVYIAPKALASELEAGADWLAQPDHRQRDKDITIGEAIARASLGVLVQNREHAAALGKAARVAVEATRA